MSHIHTKPGQHDHTVNIYIARLDGPEPKIMLHKHKKYNIYMQFGGHIELNENPWEALVRELKEETGYGINQLEVLQPKKVLKGLTGVLTHPTPISFTTHLAGVDHHHIDTAFAFITNQDPTHQPQEGESAKIKLFRRSELLAAADNEIYENGRETSLYILDECLKNWQRIPAGKIATE
jgi:8-oxo-dGTP pyrophosphatase MutT (NUDIX family)